MRKEQLKGELKPILRSGPHPDFSFLDFRLASEARGTQTRLKIKTTVYDLIHSSALNHKQYHEEEMRKEQLKRELTRSVKPAPPPLS